MAELKTWTKLKWRTLIYTQRKLNPNDVLVPVGYEIDVFADGLTTPINLTFTSNGEMLVADSGITDGNGKVLS